ncbi:hypothetical protein O6H91_11G011200 [Diphasiastrum complanatum]|uniref:Uncharacterized protein n=1 Tax=Diphasiastrum complanatum TaxID=34168 RepID=A0ACC2C6A1_DIPCM|nr:hypothetical protein O6H91_11G011200 [Diphasiastrum complanatum]
MDQNMPSLALVLQFMWLAAIAACVVSMLPLKFVIPLQSAILACCRRGKLVDRSKNQRFNVPHSFFTHFYLVAVIWNTFLLLAAAAFACLCTSSVSSSTFQFSTLVWQISGEGASSSVLPGNSVLSLTSCSEWASRTFFLHLLMEIHVVRRLYESSFIVKYSPGAQMHVMGYLSGILYYVVAPLSLCARSCWTMFRSIMQMFVQSILKRQIHSHQSALVAPGELEWREYGKILMTLGWWQWIGAFVVLWGSVHQYRCHVILASLRIRDQVVEKTNLPQQSTRGSTYAIPFGDWFEVVSSPHYLAEIVIYGGIFIASGGTDLTIILLFIWVVSNLLLAGLETHKWYQSKFDNYPKRWAIFPLIC